MRLSFNQIEAIKQEAGHDSGSGAQVWLSGSRLSDHQRGFTLVELIMVMVIVGILAVVVLPRFFDADIFKSRGFADQVQATLRYAQKAAIAQHRNVCVAITAGNIALTIANANPSLPTSPCNKNLAIPGQSTPGQTNQISTPSAAITLSPATTFNFDALGKPWDVLGTTPSTVQKSIAVSNVTNLIHVEAETGYVHSP